MMLSDIDANMNYEEKLKLCNLKLELKLERCDHLVKQYEKSPSFNDSNIKVALTESGKSGISNKRKISPKLCWGCLEEGQLKNMHVAQFSDGFKEVYADMVEYCFSMKVDKSKRINYICQNCIRKLRDTLRFMKQIQIAQDYLNQAIGGSPVNTNVYTGQQQIEQDKSSSPSIKMETAPIVDLRHISTPTISLTPVNISTANIANLQAQPLSCKPVVGSPNMFYINNSLKPVSLVPVQDAEILNYLQSKMSPENVHSASVINASMQIPSTDKLRQILENKINTNKVIIIQQKPTSGIANNICDVIHEIQEDSDDDVQVVETDAGMNNLSVETSNETSNALMDVDFATSFEGSGDYINDEECSQKSDYITYEDLQAAKTTAELIDSIKFDGFCVCPLCPEKFTSTSDRRLHLHDAHPITRSNYMCEECGITVQRKSSMNRHIKNKHLVKLQSPVFLKQEDWPE